MSEEVLKNDVVETEYDASQIQVLDAYGRRIAVCFGYTARTYPHTVLSVSVRHSLLLLSAVCAVHG